MERRDLQQFPKLFSQPPRRRAWSTSVYPQAVQLRQRRNRRRARELAKLGVHATAPVQEHATASAQEQATLSAHEHAAVSAQERPDPHREVRRR